MSAAQIAAEVGLSKAAVLNRLHAQGIRSETLKTIAPTHSPPAVRAPFGKKVVAGKLVDCRREMSLVRYIVELRARRGRKWKDVAEQLNSDGHRTRNGRPWTIGTTKNVFDRWDGKI